MLCFTGWRDGLAPGIEFKRNRIRIGRGKLILDAQLKSSTDKTAVKRSFWRRKTVIYRCTFQHDQQYRMARLLPPQQQSKQCAAPQSALIFLDVGRVDLGWYSTDFELTAAPDSVIFTEFNSDYLGSCGGDYSYLFLLKPGESVTFHQVQHDGGGMEKVFTIFFDGENATHTCHHLRGPFEGIVATNC